MRYREHVALIYGVSGQTLEFYPPTDEIIQDGPPAVAATCTFYKGDFSNDDSNAVAFTATPTIDSVSTTTDESCGPSAANRSRVPLAATTNTAIGKRYLLTNTAAGGSQRQVITPKAVLSADSVTHIGEVAYAFASGSAFVGLRHVVTVDSTFINTAANINFFGTSSLVGGADAGRPVPPYRAVWAYTTAGGIVRRYTTTFDVCRAPLKHGVGEPDIRGILPDAELDAWLADRGTGFAAQIAEGFTRVRIDARASGYDPDIILDPEAMNRLVTMATVAHLAQHGIGRPKDRAPEAWAADWEKRYTDLFARMVGTVFKVWAQQDATGAIAAESTQRMGLKR